MKVIPPESFGPLSDATLLGVAWQESGRDLVVEVEEAGASSRRFVFTWVSQVKILLTQGHNDPSQPMAWEANATPCGRGRVQVKLEFPPHGEISLECQEIGDGE